MPYRWLAGDAVSVVVDDGTGTVIGSVTVVPPGVVTGVGVCEPAVVDAGTVTSTVAEPLRARRVP